mmetsp:Transcript_47150/g.78256  ORF Transcript_47150/g.78256 Transcript_47150/m.78256 type:complete len:97 (+) Transcript_47150:11-301(+)
MAAPKDEVIHQFQVDAFYDAAKNIIKLTVNELKTKKTWQTNLDKSHFADVYATYQKIKGAVDSNKLACAYPEQGQALDLVIMTHPDYVTAELPELK